MKLWELPPKAVEILRGVDLALRVQFLPAVDYRAIRKAAVRQLDRAVAELWKERKNIAFVKLSRIYYTIGYLAKARDAILTTSELSDIREILEEVREAGPSTMEGPPLGVKKTPRRKATDQSAA